MRIITGLGCKYVLRAAAVLPKSLPAPFQHRDMLLIAVHSSTLQPSLPAHSAHIPPMGTWVLDHVRMHGTSRAQGRKWTQSERQVAPHAPHRNISQPRHIGVASKVEKGTMDCVRPRTIWHAGSRVPSCTCDTYCTACGSLRTITDVEHMTGIICHVGQAKNNLWSGPILE